MIIIIDSIDRVGKTTLATKLAEALNAKIYKHCVKNADYGVMKDDCETQAMFALINLANLFKDDIIIFDRFIYTYIILFFQKIITNWRYWRYTINV